MVYVVLCKFVFKIHVQRLCCHTNYKYNHYIEYTNIYIRYRMKGMDFELDAHTEYQLNIIHIIINILRKYKKINRIPYINCIL